MEKEDKIGIFVILIITLASISALLDDNITIRRIEQSTSTLEGYDEIMAIAENISNREYIMDVYDCSDMTSDLVIKLRNNGYKAEYVIGWSRFKDSCDDYNVSDRNREYWNGSCWGYHAWTRVWVKGKNFDIESTTGMFIYPFEYFEDYIEE